MNGLASLPWYDLAEVRSAVDAFWQGLRRHLLEQGLAAPPQLNRVMPICQQWSHPELLLTQACGYDVVLSSRHELQLVATPSFRLEGLRPGHYRSLVVVRESSPYAELRELLGTRCAINNSTSHSGMNCLRFLLVQLHQRGAFFSKLMVSGSHRRSLELVTQGEAEVAAIDQVSFTLLQEHCPELTAGVRVIAETEQVPAPPYVTSRRASPDTVKRLRSALAAAFEDQATARCREVLLLEGVEFIELGEYEVIAQMEAKARGRIECDSWPSTVS